MTIAAAGLVVWDVDGTLIPADLRWLRRAIARTYGLVESGVVFPSAKVHGYTDESIVVDAAVCSGVEPGEAEAGVARFHRELKKIMAGAGVELARDQPAYPGARESIRSLHDAGFVQTVLTGNLRFAAEAKLAAAGLDRYLNLDVGGFGSDARDRFALPAIVTGRYQKVYGQLINPENVVVIGDAPNDIACARHAGFHAVVVAHRASRDDLARHRPDLILDDLRAEGVVAAVSSLAGR